ncbi:MAG TPA: TonB-dependent receptor plug domain-containing protein [Pyrinomonadaceae bacterium]|nr:TonB-dependent receptor plug domain-containing protein [Pyrinomonadaceae bacterium]
MKIIKILSLISFLTICVSAQQSTPTPTPTPAIKETVTVSANTDQTIEQVSKTVNVIDAQEMRDRADFSLVESLRTIPGFRVQQLGGFGRTANIKTRGLRNQDTAVLIDGIRFRDASSITGDASAFLSDFTLTSVNKIEVLRGSGSSLYGTNAIGGTIDFQTPKPQTGWHGQIGGAFGGLGLGRFRGNTSYGTDKFGFNVGGSRTVFTKGIDGDDDARNTNFQSRIEYNPFKKTNISARFFVSDAFVRLNSNPDTFGVLPASNATIIDANPRVNFTSDRDDPDNSQKSKFFNGQIVLTQIISDRIIFQGYYSGLKTSRKNDNGTLGIGFQSASTSIFDGTIQTANGHFNYTPNKFNEITAGYEFEHEKYGNDGFTPSGAGNFFTRAKQASNTFYVQDLISLLNGNLQIAGGFRTQIFSLKTPAFSSNNAPYANLTLENPPTAYTFDGSAAYFFDKSGTKLRAHVGNGYRVPSLYERFGTFYATFLTPNRFVPLGAPDLKPEKTIAFDGGIEQNLFSDRAKLTAVYFYTKLIDTIGYGNLPQPDRFGRSNSLSGGGYLNTKGGIARGAEFSGRVRASDSTDIFASYTFTNSDQRVPQVMGNRNISTLGIPDHQFTLVATQRFKRAWVNFDFLATSDYLAPIFSNTTFATYIYRFRGNRKADLTGGYTFPFRNDKLALRVFGTIENIFDDEYFENGFRTGGATARLGVSFGF